MFRPILLVLSVLIFGFCAGMFVDPSTEEMRQALVLVPQNAREVEACFQLADEIHMDRGGESAYDVCSQNEVAYRAWKNEQQVSELHQLDGIEAELSRPLNR